MSPVRRRLLPRFEQSSDAEQTGILLSDQLNSCFQMLQEPEAADDQRLHAGTAPQAAHRRHRAGRMVSQAPRKLYVHESLRSLLHVARKARQQLQLSTLLLRDSCVLMHGDLIRDNCILTAGTANLQVVFADLATTPARVRISHARTAPSDAAGYSLLGEAVLAAGKAGEGADPAET